MGTRGIKICKGCRRSFEPQLTDDEIFDLWFTQEEIEADEEHEAQTGHSHLEAPTQELCGKCAMDPDLYPVYGPFGGPPQYRRKSKMKRLPVQDSNVIQLPRHPGHLLQDMLDSAPQLDVHKVKASDGTEMEIHGPLPPQEIIDAMAQAVKAGQVEGTITPRAKATARITITRTKKKASIWERIFGNKKKDDGKTG